MMLSKEKRRRDQAVIKVWIICCYEGRSLSLWESPDPCVICRVFCYPGWCQKLHMPPKGPPGELRL